MPYFEELIQLWSRKIYRIITVEKESKREVQEHKGRG